MQLCDGKGICLNFQQVSTPSRPPVVHFIDFGDNYTGPCFFGNAKDCKGQVPIFLNTYNGSCQVILLNLQ